jgi:integrase
MADDLSLQAVSRYVALRRSDGVASGTINRELRFLSAAINEYNRFNGTNIKNNAGAALQQEPAGIVRWITKEEAERLIASARPMVADFIRVALYTGLRKEAVLSLQWTDIDFERGVINVRPKDAPKAKPRAKALPIHPVCREGLLSRKQANGDYPYVFPHRHGKGHAMYMFSGFKAACEAAGIKNFRVHDMRHTLASWLIMAGRPLIEVRDILGHKSVKQSERYAHLAPENLRQAMESI